MDFATVRRTLDALGVKGPFLVATLKELPAHDVWTPLLIMREPGDQAEADRIRSTRSCVSTSGDQIEPHTEDPFLVLPANTEHPGGLRGLVYVVERLMGPGGCPWDLKQTHETLKKYLLEEAYELYDAIDRGDTPAIQEELGDVLLQPLMHAEIKRKEGVFSIEDVAHGTADKLVRRHPHVFGTTEVADADEVLRNWDRIKQLEKGTTEAPTSLLAGVARSTPALLRAYTVSKRAARVGFEWQDLDGVIDKLHEELAEVKAAMASGSEAELASEIGDLLFTVVNIARWLGVEPEEALRTMVDRFTDRFQHMELHATKPLGELDTKEWDDLWKASKRAQKA